MATIKDYFDIDFRQASISENWEIKSETNSVLNPIIAKIILNFDENSKYWQFFIQEGSHIESYINLILTSPKTEKCSHPLPFAMGSAITNELTSSETMTFTRKLYLYIDDFIEKSKINTIIDLGKISGFNVTVRDRRYAKDKSALEKPLAFISHDSRDQNALVRELAIEMTRLGCSVWYAEFSLKVGDSLRESIERGLKETQKCIIILSPFFLSNKGWSKNEFDSIYVREIYEKKNIMLPVWHNVEEKEIYEYCPRLLDKFALQSSLGAKELAKRLADVIIKDDE